MLLNGKFVSESQAKISPFDHGFLYGDGIYETLRTYNGIVWHLEAHLDRLYQSADLLHLKLSWPKRRVCTWIEETVLRNMRPRRELRIRVTVSRGMNQYNFVTSKKPTILISTQTLIPEKHFVYSRGVSVITVPLERILPRAKTVNLLPFILAQQVCARESAYEAFFLNRNGCVTEGSVTNVFIVKRRVLLTPKDDILYGTTRTVVLEVVDMPFKEREISLRELYTADECFITNTVKGVVPVVRVDGKKIGDGKVGVFTQKIMKAFEQCVYENL